MGNLLSDQRALAHDCLRRNESIRLNAGLISVSESSLGLAKLGGDQREQGVVKTSQEEAFGRSANQHAGPAVGCNPEIASHVEGAEIYGGLVGGMDAAAALCRSGKASGKRIEGPICDLGAADIRGADAAKRQLHSTSVVRGPPPAEQAASASFDCPKHEPLVCASHLAPHDARPDPRPQDGRTKRGLLAPGDEAHDRPGQMPQSARFYGTPVCSIPYHDQGSSQKANDVTQAQPCRRESNVSLSESKPLLVRTLASLRTPDMALFCVLAPLLAATRADQ